jgi:ATP-binding cassette subfamily C protein CydC
MKIVWRLLAFLKPFTGQVAVSVLLSAGVVASGIGLLGTSAYLIASAALQPSVGALQVAIVGVRFFGISRGLLRYFERLTTHSVNFHLLARLRVWFYQTIEPLAPAGLQDRHSGDLLSVAVGDIAALENFYVRAVAPPISAVLVTVGVCGFVFAYHPNFSLILLAGLLIAGLVLPLLAYKAAKTPGQLTREARAALQTVVVELAQGLADIIAYRQEGARLAEVGAKSEALSKAQMQVVRVGAAANALMFFVENMTTWGVLVGAVHLVNAGVISGVDMAVLVLIAQSSFEAVQPLAPAAQHLGVSIAAGRRLFQFSEEDPTIRPPVNPVPAPVGFDLRLENVYFRYAPDLPPALAEVTMQLRPGQKLAVVGTSGAGKTTLVNLLLRFWDIQEGAITLDGLDIRCYQPAEVRRKMGVVSQNAYLFSGSLRRNLLLADDHAEDGEMIRALEQAGLSEWLRSLPKGLDTRIGEHGRLVSGGERQRIALARCILKNAPVLLLDEPTANLDALTERLFLNTLFEQFGERSLLWITHRFAGLEPMDEIIVLDGGRIVEQGTHQDLLKLGGRYTRMATLQRGILTDEPLE